MSWSRRPRPIADRFWAKVDKRGPDDCWEWSASLTFGGYGALGAGPVQPNRIVQAHRFSWELHCGPVPAGLCVCHRCDNRRCVNPAHLFLGSYRDNIHDMLAKGRQNNQRKTHCPRGHGYTAENTRIYDGGRFCISCERDRTARRAEQRQLGRGAF